ncbi:MAG: purine-nucleoside phosphorylase [Eubacteriales bacterium]|nr:purine-nucleoside phosphorylase [Eubacteriales bacterium]
MSLHIAASKGEIAESILLPGDPLRAQFIAENYLDSPRLYNDIRNMLGYTGSYRGVPVSVMGTGMGMPSIGIYSWELMTEYGVQNLIRIGTAGSIREDLGIRDMVLAISACTDSSYVDNYFSTGKYAPTASWDLMCRARDTAVRLGMPLTAGPIFSSDVFYRLQPAYYEKWAEMGCLAVEMETAALYMNAAYHGRSALSILTISDNIVTGEHSTALERQTSFNDMMKLALETVVS